MNPYVSAETFRLLLPEIILVAAATTLYVAGAFSRNKSAWSWLAGAALLAAGICLASQGADSGDKKPGPLITDDLTWFVRWLMLIVGSLFVLLSAKGASLGQAPEYVGSLLMVVAGTMLVAGANDLVLLFLGLELVSIPTYVLLYLGRRDANSQEATAKYFFLSIFSSAVLLYGFSFLYGIAGATHFAHIHDALWNQAIDHPGWLPLTGVAVVFILAGLGFKIAAVPFHFYAPDVYQGTSHANAGLLAVVPKIAGIVALSRLAVLFAGANEFDVGWTMVLSLSVASMTLGNVLALWQDNLRRLLAYSSIAHAGYLLIGLAVVLAANLDGVATGVDGLGALLFYLAVYAFGAIGAFAAFSFLGDGQRQIDDIHELSGLSRTRPFVALAIAAFMLSLAGIPPLAGFLGKLTLFISALGVQSETNSNLTNSFLILAISGAINAAIAAAYYLRVVGVMYFGDPAPRPKAEGGSGARSAMLVSLLLVVGLGIFPTLLMNGAEKAAEAARGSQSQRERTTIRADRPVAE